MFEETPSNLSSMMIDSVPTRFVIGDSDTLLNPFLSYRRIAGLSALTLRLTPG